MPKALAASEMELGELMKEMVCRELCCGSWTYCPAGPLCAPASTGAAGSPQAGKLVTRIKGGGHQPSVGTCGQHK